MQTCAKSSPPVSSLSTAARRTATISTLPRSSSSTSLAITKKNAAISPSSSSSSSSGKQQGCQNRLHYIMLTFLVCLAAWQSLLQSSRSSASAMEHLFVFSSSSYSSPSSPTSTIVSSERSIIEHENVDDAGDTSNKIRGDGAAISSQTAQSSKSKQQQPQSEPQKQPSQQQPDVPQQEPLDEAKKELVQSHQNLEVPPTLARPSVDDKIKNSTLQLAAPEPAISPPGTALVRHPVIVDTTVTEIPKIIWMFWETGWPAKLSPYANMNRRSWELANPTFTVHALDGPTAERLTNRSLHVPDERWQVLHVQARSDIYRTLLLQKYGGIWADCNVFCNRPVQFWLDMNSTDLVSFRREDNLSEQVKKGIKPWITSWFLATPPGSYTISKVMKVISDPAEHYRFRAQYFWWHHMVAQIANTDPRVNGVIQNFTPPGTCGGKNWTSQATVLKRCANKGLIPAIVFTTEQCCPAIGGRPHIIMTSDDATTITMQQLNNSNANMTAATMMDEIKQQQLAELCAKWNCTVQAENMVHGDAIRKFWGMERIRTLITDYLGP
jgi:hypothetical protein